MIFGDPYEGFEGFQFLKKAWKSMQTHMLKIDKNVPKIEIWRLRWLIFDIPEGFGCIRNSKMGCLCLWVPIVCSLNSKHAFLALRVAICDPRRASRSFRSRTGVQAWALSRALSYIDYSIDSIILYRLFDYSIDSMIRRSALHALTQRVGGFNVMDGHTRRTYEETKLF